MRAPSGGKNSPLDIVFEDTHLLVLNKPAGLLTQSDISGDASLVDLLRAYLGRPYVGLVHRLDRNTSGLIVVAKRTKAARRLTDSLQAGELKRWYQAWLWGKLPVGAPQRWRHTLAKDAATNTVRLARPGEPGAKHAELVASPLRGTHFGGEDVTLVEFELDTGRSHQIRVQASAQGHPLLGDVKYQGASRRPPFSRLALHSVRVEFPHPMSDKGLRFSSELPPELKELP